jgi:hypothetical protein
MATVVDTTIIYRLYHETNENLGQDFIISVKDTNDNLSSVTTTPAINTKFVISSWIFIKILNGPNEILRGPGETDP